MAETVMAGVDGNGVGTVGVVGVVIAVFCTAGAFVIGVDGTGVNGIFMRKSAKKFINN